jgi:hypothetical protein
MLIPAVSMHACLPPCAHSRDDFRFEQLGTSICGFFLYFHIRQNFKYKTTTTRCIAPLGLNREDIHCALNVHLGWWRAPRERYTLNLQAVPPNAMLSTEK